jgi:ketosteroid isomerase-like protein
MVAARERRRALANSYAWVMRTRDSQVIDGTAFYDSIAFNDLCTRMPPE